MNILYIAYSCDPYKGSEDKTGWSVPLESAKTNNVYVITKEEQRASIEKYLSLHEVNNIEFYFIDIPNFYKKLFNGFMYSGRLNIWNKRAFPLAKKICRENNINIIHQITPMEFRSIGDYGKIPDIKFVCGPLGGGEFLPKGLKDYAKGNRTVENVRLIINYWYRFKLKFTGKLKKCDYIMFANKETHDFLVGGRQSIRCDNDFFSDAGLSENDLIGINNRDGQPHKMIFLVAGRLIYRKGHKFLFDALSGISPELDFEVRVVGTGEESQNLKSICAKSEILSKYVTLVGGIPYTKMAEEFNNADVLIMPSIRETTGNVLLEAMSKGIPVITIKKFGGKVLLDDETAFLYEGTSKEEYINNLRSSIVYCVNNPKEVKRRGSNARLKAENHTWEVKNKHFQEIYRGLLNVK